MRCIVDFYVYQPTTLTLKHAGVGNVAVSLPLMPMVAEDDGIEPFLNHVLSEAQITVDVQGINLSSDTNWEFISEYGTIVLKRYLCRGSTQLQHTVVAPPHTCVQKIAHFRFVIDIDVASFLLSYTHHYVQHHQSRQYISTEGFDRQLDGSWVVSEWLNPHASL